MAIICSGAKAALLVVRVMGVLAELACHVHTSVLVSDFAHPLRTRPRESNCVRVNCIYYSEDLLQKKKRSTLCVLTCGTRALYYFRFFPFSALIFAFFSPFDSRVFLIYFFLFFIISGIIVV